MRFETAAIHYGQDPDPATGALITPVYQTSTFVFQDIGKTKGFDYTRSGNPTRKALESTLAMLEAGKDCLACATGMAAETTVMHLLQQGDHVISQEDLYGGTFRLFQDVMVRFGIEFTFLKMEDRDEIENAIRPNTRMIWAETLSNPLLKVVDIDMIAALGRERGILTVVDNTLPSPYLLRPIEHGIDLVVHSTTKYLNGHSDVVGGAVVTSTAELGERIHFFQNALGISESPFDSWLVSRGLKTLAVRMERHCKSADAVARFLTNHRKIMKVFYPGLREHPDHKLAVKLMSDFGGMVSFEIEGGVQAVNSFLRKVKVFSLAESLGGVDSLAEHPDTMSHASMPQEFRRKVGISENLVRLSVGLEHIDDLIEDLDQALS